MIDIVTAATQQNAATIKKGADMAQNAQKGTVNSLQTLISEELQLMVEISPEASIFQKHIEELSQLCVAVLRVENCYKRRAGNDPDAKKLKKDLSLLILSIETMFYDITGSLMDDIYNFVIK